MRILSLLLFALALPAWAQDDKKEEETKEEE